MVFMSLYFMFLYCLGERALSARYENGEPGYKSALAPQEDEKI